MKKQTIHHEVRFSTDVDSVESALDQMVLDGWIGWGDDGFTMSDTGIELMRSWLDACGLTLLTDFDPDKVLEEIGVHHVELIPDSMAGAPLHGLLLLRWMQRVAFEERRKWLQGQLSQPG